ncbi:hypothetical protein [Klebsiella sp. WP4-W18-ESBL-05]|uniref:hypothetical protein n=1 Tax=Klebsiella sp. WP4-W18-ESBL-05 TaxID=2675713 RepID=UPI0015DC5460|nr:hypothetical protein [Klebsiella sp. WP4-W18-ESBL-05]BBR58939.1 hypothetical protein WP4W18E05_23070 [Klebsiella sp. WP4-W18-ESBL-05]
MRRLVQYWQPLPAENVGGITRQEYSEQHSAFLSMQPVDGNGSFRQYLAARKPHEYIEAIGETDLAVTEEGAHNGALVLCGGKYYEVVQRQEWQNGVINHFEYLLFMMKERDALALVG